MEARKPDKSRAATRRAVENLVRKTWGDLVEEFCQTVYVEYSSPCKCRGNDPERLVHSNGQLRNTEFPNEDAWTNVDPFGVVGVGGLNGGAS